MDKSHSGVGQTPTGTKEETRGVVSGGGDAGGVGGNGKQKPPFILVEDDTKPLLRDPIMRSDPIDTEQAVLRLPPISNGSAQF